MKQLITLLAMIILVLNLNGCVAAWIAGAAATGAGAGYYFKKNYQVNPRYAKSSNYSNSNSNSNDNGYSNNDYNSKATAYPGY